VSDLLGYAVLGLGPTPCPEAKKALVVLGGGKFELVNDDDGYLDYELYFSDMNNVGGRVRLTLSVDDCGYVQKAYMGILGDKDEGETILFEKEVDNIPVAWAVAITGYIAPGCSDDYDDDNDDEEEDEEWVVGSDDEEEADIIVLGGESAILIKGGTESKEYEIPF